MKQVSKIADTGKVVESPAAAMTVAATAEYLDCSTSWLNSTRAADAKRLARGESPIGPPWVLLRFGVRYLRGDVDAWIANTAVRGGVSEGHRRVKVADRP